VSNSALKIRWQPKEIPESGMLAGDGMCFARGDENSGVGTLVAFVEGYSWLRRGDDAVVLFNPAHFPMNEPQHSELKAAIERALRHPQFYGEIAPGYLVSANA
jgi:hypothetical protein